MEMMVCKLLRNAIGIGYCIYSFFASPHKTILVLETYGFHVTLYQHCLWSVSQVSNFSTKGLVRRDTLLKKARITLPGLKTEPIV